MTKFAGFMAALCVSCLALGAPARAGTITISDQAKAEQLELKVSDVRLGAILSSLGRKFGFEVESPGPAPRARPISATFKGSLDQILQRLLRNRNHMIVRQKGSSTGIARIIVLDTKAGSKTTPLRAHPAKRPRLKRKRKPRREVNNARAAWFVPRPGKREPDMID